MKTFKAYIKEYYEWECPWCGETNWNIDDDPAREINICESCGKNAYCEKTERLKP